MTLIELLVVIVILTTVVAAAIPIMAPSNVDRQLRETTRGLNTYITGAQARAIATGRPYGIALKRLAQDTDNDTNPDNAHEDNGVCLEVFYVEEQPPFSGFDRNSRACVSLIQNTGLVTVRFITRGTQYAQNQDRLPVGWDADLFPPDTIRPGDVIEIGDTRYELTSVDQSSYDFKTGFYVPPGNPRIAMSIAARPINNTGQQINPEYDHRGNELGTVAQRNPPYWTRPAPYKILRQGTITSDEPYQLPEGTAIDLRASGVGNDAFFYVPRFDNANGVVDNSKPVIIMFTPEGRIASVSFSRMPQNTSREPGDFDGSVTDNVYLLVGKRENIPAPAATDPAADPTLNSNEWSNFTTDEARREKKEPINWLSGSSRWIVIGSQSGRIVTVENAFVDPQSVFMFAINQTPPVAQSSEELRSEQILAAREFTREMSQLGGR